MRYLIFRFMTLCFVLVALIACKHERVELARPNDDFRPAALYLQNNGEFSLLYAALQRTGLVTEWSAGGTYTFFAPNNQAFNEWGIQLPQDFDKIPVDSLRTILQYHVLNGRLNSANIPQQSVDNPFATLAGDTLLIAKGASALNIYVNGATITRTDIVLGNGIMHAINKVLKYDRGTLQHLLENQPDLKIFTAALKKFGYWDQLARAGSHTIVAPTDSAFKKAGLTMEAIQVLDTSHYGRRLFGEYVFNNQFFMKDLSILRKTGNGGNYSQEGAPVRLPIAGDEGYSHGMSSAYLIEFFVALTSWEEFGAPWPIHVISMNKEAQMDYLTKNGILHKVDDVALLPEEAHK